MSELKPCPFCGNAPRVNKRKDECLWSHNIVEWTGVRCTECDVGFDWPEGAEPDAITQWNARALPSAELERDAADAARYRWIRKRMDLIGTDDYAEFDKDVDRAMHNDAVARAKEPRR